MTLREDACIFINYRRIDAAWPAEAVSERLKAAFGETRVYCDMRDIHAGDRWNEELDEALKRAEVLLVMIGKDWLYARDEAGRRRLDQRDDWVAREILTGLRKEGCRVITVLVEDAELPKKDDLPHRLRELLDRQQRPRLRLLYKDQDLDALVRIIEDAGFRRVTPTPAELSGQAAAIGPIHLRRPLEVEDVDSDLADRIKRAEIYLSEYERWLATPPLAEEEFRKHSDAYHEWRRELEHTLIPKSFTHPDELIRRLPVVRYDRHGVWQDKVKALLRDWRQDVDHLKGLRSHLQIFAQGRSLS